MPRPLAPRAAAPTRSLLFLLAVLLALGGVFPTPVAQAVEQVPAVSYRLDANVDFDAGHVDTSETVTYRNVVGVPLASLVFRVVPNVVGSFELRQASVDGQPVSPAIDASVMELPLARPLAPGASAEIKLDFAIEPPAERGRLAA